MNWWSEEMRIQEQCNNEKRCMNKLLPSLRKRKRKPKKNKIKMKNEVDEVGSAKG